MTFDLMISMASEQITYFHNKQKKHNDNNLMVYILELFLSAKRLRKLGFIEGCHVSGTGKVRAACHTSVTTVRQLATAIIESGSPKLIDIVWHGRNAPSHTESQIVTSQQIKPGPKGTVTNVGMLMWASHIVVTVIGPNLCRTRNFR